MKIKPYRVMTGEDTAALRMDIRWNGMNVPLSAGLVFVYVATLSLKPEGT